MLILKNGKNMKLCMQINKKRIFALLMLTLITGKLLYEKFDNRPIKFEDFKTSEELNKFIIANYHIGSYGADFVNHLKNSKAKCREIGPNGLYFSQSPKNYKFIKECKYLTGLVSIAPLKSYQLIIYEDQEHKIIEIWSAVHNTPN